MSTHDYPPKTDTELKLEEAKAKLAELEAKKEQIAQNATDARAIKQAEIDAIKAKLEAKKAPSTTVPTPASAPMAPGTPSPTPTTPGAGPVPKTPEEIEAERIRLENEERNRKQKEKQAKIDQKKRDIERILEDAKQTQQHKIEKAREIYLQDHKHGVSEISENRVLRNAAKLRHFLGIKHKYDDIDSYTYEDGTSVNATTKAKYNEEKDEKGDRTLEDFVQKRVAERKAKLLAMENPNKGNPESEKNWFKWEDHNIKNLQNRYKKMLASSENRNEAFNNKDLAFFTAENRQLNTLREAIWNDVETNRQQKKKDRKDIKEAHQKDILENGKILEKFKVRAERLLVKSEYLINNKATRWAIGNKYARFALMTGAIGAFTGGFSTLFLANRIVRFGGGIIGGTIGKKIADATWTVERTQRKRMAELQKDFQDGKVSASEYDKRIEEIERVINKQQHLYKILATGTGAFAGGWGINKIDNNYLDGYLTNKTQSGLDFVGDKTGKGWDWVKDHMPWSDGDTPDASSQPESTEKTILEKGASPANPAPQPTTNPNEYSIVRPGSGHGVEHTFHDKIVQDATFRAELAKMLNYKGDLTSQAGIDKFADFGAHKISTSAGYVDELTKQERWVFGNKPVAFEPEIKNGEIIVHERVLEDGKWVDRDIEDSTSSKFEIGNDKSTDGHVYEKTHAGYHPEHSKIQHIKASIEQDFIQKKPLINIDDRLGNDVINTDSEYIKPRNIEDDNLGNDVIDGDGNLNDEYTPKKALENLNHGSRLPHTQPDPGTFDDSHTQPDPGTPTRGSIYNPRPIQEGFSSGPSFLDILFGIFFGGGAVQQVSKKDTSSKP